MSDLKGNVLKAFNALEKMGVPVKDSDHNGGHFYISAEEENSPEWLDYHNGSKSWGDWTINDKVHEVLNANDLYPEWANPGYCVVYDA